MVPTGSWSGSYDLRSRPPIRQLLLDGRSQQLDPCKTSVNMPHRLQASFESLRHGSTNASDDSNLQKFSTRYA